MSVIVPCIREAEEITKCEILPIRQQLWGSRYPVRAYGRMALIPEKEWIVELTAEEPNPMRRYYNSNDPVYLDSALEVFLNFQPEDGRNRYINLEANANGALLSEFGIKGNRRYISDITGEWSVHCEKKLEQESWSVRFRIPLELIRELYSAEVMKTGGEFTFALYKISETPVIEHYISYADIPAEKPDFHLPQYFARGKVIFEIHKWNK